MTRRFSISGTVAHLISLALSLFIVLAIPLCARADITTGLVGRWAFDAGSGSTASDSSGFGNSGSLTGNTAWISGHIGAGALSFDGTGDYVTLGQPSTFDMSGTNAFTISFWAYPDLDTRDSVVFGRGAVGSSAANMVYGAFQYQGGPRWGAQVSDGTTLISALSSNGTVTANTWQHIIVTWNGTTKTLNIYNNGNQIASATDPAFTTLWDGGATAANRATGIGVNPRQLISEFQGDLDDVRMYNRVLSSGDIAELYAYNGSGPDTDAPIVANGSPSGSLSAGVTQATLSVGTDENATCKYGTTASTAYGSIANTFTTTGGTTHSSTLTGLSVGPHTYYIRCQDSSNNANSSDYTVTFTTVAAVGGTTSSLTQYGITWNFSSPVQYGQFVTGDYWVLGPVTVSSVTPAWDGTKNGSMLDPVPLAAQGFDSRTNSYTFSDANRVHFPVTISGGTKSLLSAVGMPVIQSGGAHSALSDMAVLTVVSSEPAANSFRPPFVSGSKPIWNTSQVNYSLVPSLSTPSGITIPDMSDALVRINPYFGPQVSTTEIIPENNVDSPYPAYENAVSSVLALEAMLNIPQQQEYINRLIQRGIDHYSISLQNESGFQANGGFGVGLKWPILFAGILLNDSGMKSPPLYDPSVGNGSVIFKFSEDGYTYLGASTPTYPSGWPGFGLDYTGMGYNVANCQSNCMARDPDGLLDPEIKWPPQYKGDYRQLVSPYWVGQTVAAYIMNAKSIWNHNLYFDYMDRWISEPNTWTDISTNIAREAYGYGDGSGFVHAMWDLYRSSAPTMSTQSASSIGQTTATLNGTIAATGSATPTIRGFAYGTSATLATTIATTSASGSFSAGAFTGSISSLTCNTTYYFRPYATNSNGTGYGNISSFTTSACSTTATTTTTTASGGGGGGGGGGSTTNDSKAPVISSVIVSASDSTAVISWTTDKVSTSQIEYGLTSSYGNSTALNTSTSLSHTQTISGLSANTKYYFRVKSRDINSNLTTSSGMSFATGKLGTSLAKVTVTTIGGTSSATTPAVSTTVVPSASSVSYSFARDLTISVSGPDVLALQQFLNAKGFVISTAGPGSKGNETQYFGPATQSALAKFQAASNLPATGYFGPLTRALILKAAVSVPVTTTNPTVPNTKQPSVTAPATTAKPPASPVTTAPKATSTASATSTVSASSTKTTAPARATTTAPASTAGTSTKPAVTTPKTTASYPPEAIPPSGRYSGNLGVGSSGSEVKALQTFLSSYPDPSIYPEKKVTGVFDSTTEAAVARYQIIRGLKRQGELGLGFVGQSTRDDINKVLGR